MDAANPDFAEIQARALEDAGLSPEDVFVLAADVEPDPQGMPVIYLPEGAPVDPERLPPLSDSEQRELGRARHRHRIAIAIREQSPALLGLMRWGAEQARQYDRDPGLWRFGWTVLDAALSREYAGRPGGGVIHNLLPHGRDANGYASELVDRVYGPQVGQFRGVYGTLFRPSVDLGGDETLAARCVTLLALHEPATMALANNDPNFVRGLLADAHASAGSWWDTLIADPLVRQLQGVLPFMAPDQAEIAAHEGPPAEAWRPLAAVMDRGLRYGLGLLGISV